MKQKEYMIYIANRNYEKFYKQGYATAGHNGPHGHQDTPVRNTAHYLIIYSYLYKTTREKRYKQICEKFVDYICKKQNESKSGAIQCMLSDKFDHLNGLIGQGWVIEGLLYCYEVLGFERCLDTAMKIYKAQKYDKDLHLWHRIELDGTDIGIDPTYNHQVWFAACSSKLAEYCDDSNIDKILRDFLTVGAKRDFRIHSNGMLKHYVNVSNEVMQKIKLRHVIKVCLTPVKSVSPKKFDSKYMEYAYHVFDLYGFSILQEKYGDLPLFSSDVYQKAIAYAENVKQVNQNCGVYSAIKNGDMFNIFSYSYNSPAFEYPYVAEINRFGDKKLHDELYEIQRKLMFNNQTGMFTRNNPDIETWNARTYEIIRYLDFWRNESEQS